MFTFIIIIITIIALLITFVVLVQSGKGGGLAGIAAGGATQQVLGARQAPDILEKATWILATAFIVLCILSNFVIDNTSSGPANSVIQERAQQEQTAPAPGALDLDAVPTDAGTAPAGDAPAPAPAEGGSSEGGDEGDGN